MDGRSLIGEEQNIVRELDDADRAVVLQIWNDEFGIENKEGQAEFVDAAIDTDQPYTYGVVAADPQTESIAGFGIIRRSNPQWVENYLHVPLEVEIPDNTAVMHISCVREAQQGRGIGTKLFNARIKWAIENECPAIVGVAWLREGRYGSAALFDQFGFERLETYEKYYLNELDGPTSCPDCGNPCECDAAIYQFGLD